MCTIGSVVEPGSVLTFKQCDLAFPTRFLAPEIRRGPTGIRYLAFTREGARGPWAGVNERGVGFVAADAYLDAEATAALGPAGDPLEGYASIVAEHASAEAAVERMIDFYGERGAPDILLVSDLEGAFLVEYSPRSGARVARRDEGYLVATNHYRMLPGGVDFDDDPSTHLRLARAEEMLDADPGLGGIHALLQDQHFGETALSICRIADLPGAHYTQATVIFRATSGRVDVSYQLNGNPRTAVLTEAEDVFRTR